MKSLFVLPAILLTLGHGAACACPPRSQLEQLLDHGDLFLGGVNGTREIPEFFQCLVATAIDQTDEELVISLELDESARNSGSPFWQFEGGDMTEDGRSSRAMYQLMGYLLDSEQRDQLSLHFQYGNRNPGQPNSARIIGRELAELSRHARVIALTGIRHSMKHRPPGMFDYVESEGMFAGNLYTHIALAAPGPGTFWGCTRTCRVQRYQPPAPGVVAGQFAVGTDIGHDYIFYLDFFTVSEPMNFNVSP